MPLKINDKVWFEFSGPKDTGKITEIDLDREDSYYVDWDDNVECGWFTEDQLNLVGTDN